MKKKIVERLMAMRCKCQDDRYSLEQDGLLMMLSNMWGPCSPGQTMHHNDRVRVYSIVMSIKSNHPLYQRLEEGCTNCASLEDPSLSPHQIFQQITLLFNNDDLKITLPPDAYDVQGIKDIDANDQSRIMITKDY